MRWLNHDAKSSFVTQRVAFLEPGLRRIIAVDLDVFCLSDFILFIWVECKDQFNIIAGPNGLRDRKKSRSRYRIGPEDDGSAAAAGIDTGNDEVFRANILYLEALGN